jgi:transcriptional regulator with XRE-family HTH domain
MSQFGKNVEMYRKRLAWTQGELAQKVGYAHAGMISQIEDGLKSPSLEKAQDLAVQLGVSLSQLVGETPALHSVTNNATGDHTVIQNIEGHYCAVHHEDLQAGLRELLRAALDEHRQWLVREVRDILLAELARGADGPPPVREVRSSETE